MSEPFQRLTVREPRQTEGNRKWSKTGRSGVHPQKTSLQWVRTAVFIAFLPEGVSPILGSHVAENLQSDQFEVTEVRESDKKIKPKTKNQLDRNLSGTYTLKTNPLAKICEFLGFFFFFLTKCLLWLVHRSSGRKWKFYCVGLLDNRTRSWQNR